MRTVPRRLTQTVFFHRTRQFACIEHRALRLLPVEGQRSLVCRVEPAHAVLLAAAYGEGHLFLLGVEGGYSHALAGLVGLVGEVRSRRLSGHINHVVIHVRTPFRHKVTLELQRLQLASRLELRHSRRDGIVHVVLAAAVRGSDDGRTTANTAVVEINRLLRIVLLYARHLETLGAEGQVDGILTGYRLQFAIDHFVSSVNITVGHALHFVLALRHCHHVINGVGAAVIAFLVGHDYLRRAAQRSIDEANQLTVLSLVFHVVRIYLAERHVECVFGHVHIFHLAVDDEFLQQRVVRFVQREVNRILAHRAVLRLHMDAGRAVHAREIGGHRLVLQQRHSVHVRHCFRIARQQHCIVQRVRMETEQRTAVNQDVIQMYDVVLHAVVMDGIRALSAALGHYLHFLYRVVLVV